VRIKVLDIDRDRQRISLGLKQTQEDPWQRVISTHRSGDVLEGTVTKVVAFGAFVEILPGVEGLVHISELADHHVENPSEVVEPGSKLNVKILEIDEERRRLSLSIKRVEGQNMAMAGLGEQIAQAEGTQGEEAEVQADAPTGQMADAFADASAVAAEEAPAAAEEEPAAEAETPSEEAPGELPAEVEASEEADPAPVAEANGASEEEQAEHQEGESVQDRPDSPDDVDEAAGDGSSDDDAQTGETEQS
ncbi:MAG TPA: S1 RNA-binding domain-containing protein, partial [Solirubrobacterales bacterium]|nr:S1 RNA-binding domain-containing protein [Solirubrobacterales bacterium]